MPETERREMVMAFRRAGGSYRDIAEAVRDHYAEAGREEELPPDWGEAAAYEDVCAELARMQAHVGEDVEDWKLIELQRIDEMHSRLYPVALGSEDVPPDVRAVAAIERLMKTRAQLLGEGSKRARRSPTRWRPGKQEEGHG